MGLGFQFKHQTKNLFIIDGVGALVSAFLLGIVLVRLEYLFGMPVQTLYILAAIPCFFMLFDLYAYFQNERSTARYLRLIAFANLAYCLISVGFLFIHAYNLSLLGWLYFIGEILVVAFIAVLELRAAN